MKLAVIIPLFLFGLQFGSSAFAETPQGPKLPPKGGGPSSAKIGTRKFVKVMVPRCAAAQETPAQCQAKSETAEYGACACPAGTKNDIPTTTVSARCMSGNTLSGKGPCAAPIFDPKIDCTCR